MKLESSRQCLRITFLVGTAGTAASGHLTCTDRQGTMQYLEVPILHLQAWLLIRYYLRSTRYYEHGPHATNGPKSSGTNRIFYNLRTDINLQLQPCLPALLCRLLTDVDAGCEKHTDSSLICPLSNYPRLCTPYVVQYNFVSEQKNNTDQKKRASVRL